MAVDIEPIIKKYRKGKREDLIPLLQELQSTAGYISEEAMVLVGNYLGLSTTKIYGLATFYDQFRFIPSGRVKILVCHGTSCFMNGSQSIIDKLKEELKISPGQTTRNGNFSIETVSCLGGCHHGPVMIVDGEYQVHSSPDKIAGLVKKLKYIIEND